MKLSTAFQGYKLASLADGLSPATTDRVRWALHKLSRFLRDPDIEDICLNDIRKFFTHLQSETSLSPASIQAIWTSIRSFYNWAEVELDIEERPDKIKMPQSESKPVIPFTQDEIKKLLTACEHCKHSNLSNGRKPFTMKRKTSYRDKAIILILLDTGLRVSEFARLLVKDVDLESGEVIVRPYRKGRKSKSRIVYISAKTIKALWRYLAERGELKEDEPLFITRDGNPMNKDNIRQLLINLGKRAGVKRVFPHKFRHTFAIQFLRNGGNVFTLQRLLGHSTLTMTKKYLALAQVDLEQAHKKASPVDNWNL